MFRALDVAFGIWIWGDLKTLLGNWFVWCMAKALSEFTCVSIDGHASWRKTSMANIKLQILWIGGKQVSWWVRWQLQNGHFQQCWKLLASTFFDVCVRTQNPRLLLPWRGTKRLLPKELLWSFVANKFSNHPSLLCTNVDAAKNLWSNHLAKSNIFQHQNLTRTLQHWQAWQRSLS